MEELQHIIEGCKKNDRNSQEKLYRQFYPALFALCRTFFDDHQEVVTALNNGMLQVFKNIAQFDAAKGSFFNWTYTIVRNAALTLLRTKKTPPVVELVADSPEPNGTNPFAQTEWQDIYRLLGQLPPTTRAVCNLHYLQGFSIKEIARALHIKEGTVKWHLAESRSRLKTIIKSNYP